MFIESALTLCCILSNFCSVYSLFDDQVGKFDWKLEFIGQVKQASFGLRDERDDKLNRVYVITDSDVLASLNAKTGHILWRQFLEEVPVGTDSVLFEVLMEEIILLHGRKLQSWDCSSGILNWETVVGDLDSSLSSALMIKSSTVGFTVAALLSDSVVGFDSSGVESWRVKLPVIRGEYRWLYYDSLNNQLVAVGARDRSGAFLVRGPMGGSEWGEPKMLVAPWIALERCAVVNDLLLCLDSSSLLYVLDLASPGTFAAKTLAGFSGRPANGFPLVTMKPSVIGANLVDGTYFGLVTNSGAAIYHVTEESDAVNGGKTIGVKTVLEIPKATAINFASVGGQVAVNALVALGLNEPSEIKFFDLKTGKPLASLDTVVILPHNRGHITKIFSAVYAKKDDVYLKTHKTLLSSYDHTLYMLTQSGKILWSRDEALANVLSAKMLELPLSESQIEVENEFETKDHSILSMLTKRLRTQALHLQKFVLQSTEEVFHLAGLLKSIRDGKDIAAAVTTKTAKEDRLERDYFNLHKMIVVTTKAGKIFGIDNKRGSVVWDLYVPDVKVFTVNGVPSFPLYLLRTTGHLPHSSLCAVLAKSTKSPKSTALITFDPITGRLVDQVELDGEVKQVMVLPTPDETGMYGMLMLDWENMIHVYPESARQRLDSEDSLFLFSIDEKSGEMTGFKVISDFKQNKLEVNQVWNGVLAVGEKSSISVVKMKRFYEHVHSQGRVLGDRNVLFKYLNPNLVAIAIEGVDVIGKNSVTVLLLDAVTGNIIFSVLHKRATGPVHLVHSENWIIYSFWNDKARRTEISTLELYEGLSQADPIRFSSLNPPPPPIVMRQAYVFPQGVGAMAVTDTEKGIAARHLLIAMPFGGVLQLPKMYLDPRRSLMPTMEQREEGLIPYIPELPIATENIINYNQSMHRVRGMHTAPSGLESTSLIFVYGIDLFYTRVNPSGTFDILKEDFDHWLIAAVLMALFLSSVVTKRLARHKDLKEAWK